ncbi:MAG: hypothetical protein ACKOTB_11975, partial [Planctomycetia bacterium]
MQPRLPGPARWMGDGRSRPLGWCGLVLVASGCLHLAVWAVLGGPWEGPVTWRKPILFGISGGLTALSLGWVWAALPRRRGDGVLAAATAWALGIEVALIDLQRWRGVASHFNRGTPADSLLYDVMGVLILFVTLVTVDLTVRTFVQRTFFSADMLLAARAGLVFLVISCVLGIWASVHGDLRLAAGLEPARVGAAGVPKFPHGVAIHAIQWLPLVAWAARAAGIGRKARWKLVLLATIGTAAVLIYALAQTFLGRGRFAAGPRTGAVLGAGVGGQVGAGAGGVPMFPPGVATHAIPGLPVVGWAARAAGIGRKARWKLVLLAT